MPVELIAERREGSRPVHLVRKGGLAEAGLSAGHLAFAEAAGFGGEAGKMLLVSGPDGALAGALFGLGDGSEGELSAGALGKSLPEGDWHFADPKSVSQLAVLGILLGSYVFTRYGKKAGPVVRLALPEGVDGDSVRRVAEAVFLVRDLVNTPTNDMGPDDLERAIRSLAVRHKAKVTVTAGDQLLDRNFPMIHAVGRASAQAPRLVDMVWGRKGAPKVTLVGKGVCFDTGGLDIKPSSSMLLMKKDMGGAANVLGLAEILMGSRLDIRLRVLVPAVENSISANAFRPGDVLTARNGTTVEIGNTDAEGRLILADALSLADEEAPDLLIDMATLTGAARVALGPDLPPFFTDDDALAEALSSAARDEEDPMWRMPLWRPYARKLSSRVADTNNVTTDGFAGSITAALFLSRFVEKARSWAHFDIFAWNPQDRAQGPQGGEAQAIRALARTIDARYRA